MKSSAGPSLAAHSDCRRGLHGRCAVEPQRSLEMKRYVSRRFFLPIFAAVLLPSLGACATSLKWTEDVKLPDGRIVTLARYQEFRGIRELFQPPTESDYWLQF